MQTDVTLDPMKDFLDDLKNYESAMSGANLTAVLMAGGEALAEDVRRLPKPRRKKTGRLGHMLDSARAVPKGRVVQVGWENYYGKFVELGTKKMKSQPHMSPMWRNNKEKYCRLMQAKLFQTI